MIVDKKEHRDLLLQVLEVASFQGRILPLAVDLIKAVHHATVAEAPHVAPPIEKK